MYSNNNSFCGQMKLRILGLSPTNFTKNCGLCKCEFTNFMRRYRVKQFEMRVNTNYSKSLDNDQDKSLYQLENLRF